LQKKTIEDIKKDKKNRGINEATRKIFDAITFSHKYTILSTIKSLSRFLTHEHAEVRQLAASVIASLIKGFMTCLQEEKDPYVLQQLVTSLVEVAQLLEPLISSGELNPDVKLYLKAAFRYTKAGVNIGKEIIKKFEEEALCKLERETLESLDKFTDNKINCSNTAYLDMYKSIVRIAEKFKLITI